MIEQIIKTQIEKTLNESLSSEIAKGLNDYFEANNIMQSIKLSIQEITDLRTYTISKASEVSGIGYVRITNAVKLGKLPAIIDGQSYRIRHTDLYYFIENLKKTTKIKESGENPNE
jgi:hypothetical protein